MVAAIALVAVLFSTGLLAADAFRDWKETARAAARKGPGGGPRPVA